jgi:hypothetical protein
MVFEDGDPTAVSLGLKALADDRRADPRVGHQHRRDPLGERIELGARRRRT